MQNHLRDHGKNRRNVLLLSAIHAQEIGKEQMQHFSPIFLCTRRISHSCVLLCECVMEQPNARSLSEMQTNIFHSECMHSVVLHFHVAQ